MADVERALRRLDKADRAVSDLETPIFLLTRGAIRVYRSHAPVKTGNLRAGIGVIESTRGQSATVGVDLNATARRPTSVSGPARPYDYVGVTRFGHKVARIYPKQLRPEASVVATKRKRLTGRSGKLAFMAGGQLLFRGSVRGYHPATDWVQDAEPEVLLEAQRVSRNFARSIDK